MALAALGERLANVERDCPELPSFSAKARARLAAQVQERPELLDRLNFDDLLLADACAAQHPIALERFEQRVMPKVRQAIRRVDSSEAFVDELTQVVRQHLLAGEGQAPRVVQYTGEGALGSWARVAATRLALNHKRDAKLADQKAHSPELAEAVQRATPELAFMRQELSGAFEEALSEALAALEPSQRLLLQQHLVDGLSLERLGRMMGLNKSTLSRRLSALEAQLMADTRTLLERRHGLDARHLESALRVFSGGLELSLKRLLTTA